MIIKDTTTSPLKPKAWTTASAASLMDTSSSSPTVTDRHNTVITHHVNPQKTQLQYQNLVCYCVTTHLREWWDRPLGTLAGPTGRDEPSPKSKWTVVWECRSPRPSEASPPLTNKTTRRWMWLKWIHELLHQPNTQDQYWWAYWLTLSYVSFVDEAWQHMTILNAEVVVRTKHISGNHSCVAAPMLLEIRPVKHTHSLSGVHTQR